MNILITAGPTREAIDPVRFISNRSTGKMGYAIADVCAKRGHAVALVSGPVHIRPPGGVKVFNVETSAEMLRAVKKKLVWCDVLIMTAAVADFRPRRISRQKIKKRNMRYSLDIEKTVDILIAVRPMKKTRVYVGFAAETSNVKKEAGRKLREKGLDLIVANDVTRKDSGFGSDTNKVVFLSADGVCKDLPLMKKTQVAGRILDWIEAKCAKNQ